MPCSHWIVQCFVMGSVIMFLSWPDLVNISKISFEFTSSPRHIYAALRQRHDIMSWVIDDCCMTFVRRCGIYVVKPSRVVGHWRGAPTTVVRQSCGCHATTVVQHRMTVLTLKKYIFWYSQQDRISKVVHVQLWFTTAQRFHDIAQRRTTLSCNSRRWPTICQDILSWHVVELHKCVVDSMWLPPKLYRVWTKMFLLLAISA